MGRRTECEEEKQLCSKILYPDTVTLRGRNRRHDGVARENLPHKSMFNCHGRKYDIRDVELLTHR